MNASAADIVTAQFYTWEYRGRGLYVTDVPVHLEPPFIPFFRHSKQTEYIDDGKQHTWLSRLSEFFKGAPQVPQIRTVELDYETLEPFMYEPDNPLSALHVRFPKERKITVERMKALIIMLSSYNPAIVSLEIIGTEEAIIIQFVSDESTIAIIETYITAYFPDAALHYSDEYLYTIIPETGYAGIHDVALQQEFFRPIHTAKNFNIDPLIGVFAILDKLREDEKGILQILFQSTCNAWSESILESVTARDGKSFFINDPTAPKVAQEKTRTPLFAVTVRTLGIADDINTALGISEQLCRALSISSKSEYNQLVPASSEGYDFETRIIDVRLRESHRLGMLLNTDELITLLHFPSETIHSRKLDASTRKTVTAPVIALNKAFVIGENYHNGITTEATVSLEDRIKHMHIIGATGTGKSTLIANLVAQDIGHDNAVVVLDPHGDLIHDIIAAVPVERLNDVILIDPSDTEFPIGFNVLHAHSDSERELLSSDLVASFRRYATSWGDQMNTVLGNAIEALLHHPTGGTLHDLRRFLIEKEYREKMLQAVPDPSILYYWLKEYPLLKSNSVGPILTRLDSFLRPRSIRNMVIQQKTIDFEKALSNKKIILCKLSQGLIGVENSYVLGSLLLSKIHQALFQRQQQSKRNPVFIYLDEFQNFITPSIADMLSGIRKYNIGLILSHQELKQLQREGSELLNSILGNVNIRITFRVGEPDAKVLEHSFRHFEATDLQNLSRGEAILSIEQPQYDCSITTYAQDVIFEDDKNQKEAFVVNNSRSIYATPRHEVEKMLYESLEFDVNKTDKKTPYEQSTQRTKEDDTIPEHSMVSSPKYSEDNTTAKDERQMPTVETTNEEETAPKNEQRIHVYLQQLIKQIAESKGYKASIEADTPSHTGKVDVLLEKDTQTIAWEISVTTNIAWEIHNIEKCLAANYDAIVMCMHDKKHAEKMKEQVIQKFHAHQSKITVIDSEHIYTFFDEQTTPQPTHTNVQKGYRVNVEYENVKDVTMEKKRNAVGKVILDAMKKMKK